MQIIINYFKTLQPKQVKKFLIIFYGVGVIGFSNPYTHAWFIHLTPIALLMNMFLLLRFHSSEFSSTILKLFIGIFIFSFVIEMIGVQSGAIFGNYKYGNGLGIKLFDTPLLIGINWLMVSYCFRIIAETLLKNKIIIIIASALGMTIYDVIIEQVAPYLDMWTWAENIIPFQNYVAWFILALIIQISIYFSRVSLKNPIAIVLTTTQLSFFVLIYLYLLFIS
ncbi:MAG: carotenoid biosynthesis protein [Bacteroidales bacterium]